MPLELSGWGQELNLEVGAISIVYSAPLPVRAGIVYLLSEEACCARVAIKRFRQSGQKQLAAAGSAPSRLGNALHQQGWSLAPSTGAQENVAPQRGQTLI